MPSARVVEALDEVEDCEPRLDLGAEASSVEELALEGREDGLAKKDSAEPERDL